MNISHEVLPSLDVKLKFKKNKYPVPLDPNLPRLYPIVVAAGARNSGKTYKITELIRLYELHGIYDTKMKHLVDQRTIIFSPTVSQNTVFTSLKSLDQEHDVIDNYTDQKLVAVIKDIQYEREQTIDYQRKLKLYNRFLKIKHLEDLNAFELQELEMMDYNPPVPCKYPWGCICHLIFDDLIGSNCFKSVGKSAFTNLCLRNRHLGCPIYVCVQSIKCLPKSIRTNANVFVIFKFASKKIILDDLYVEVSNFLTEEQFMDVLNFAHETEHDALILDFSQKKENRLKKNWNVILHIT